MTSQPLASLQAKNAGCIDNGVTDWYECANATHLLCRDQGCRTTGYGLLELGDSPIVACLTTDAPKNVTSADLAPYGTCPFTTSFAPSDKWACAKTVRNYCKAAGYATGFGPVAMPTAYQLAVVCLKSGHATEVPTTFAALGQYHSGCTDDSVVQSTSIFCVSAAKRYCVANGYVSGFGPVADPDGVSPVIVCLGN